MAGKSIEDQDIRLWHDHRVLKAVHLQGRDVTVEIESVTPGKIVGEGGKADKMPIVKFRGKTLPFGLNRTNENTLIQLFGPTPRGMIGKKITLYPTTTRGAKGSIVDCIRIRPSVPGGPADTTPDREEPPSDTNGDPS